MGRFGELYQNEPERALDLAEKCGWLMATEVLAVGIDFSFAPVLDLNDISDVIGDRAFAARPADIIALADAFLRGMHRAGMATTGKHFPGHGSVKADFSCCCRDRFTFFCRNSATGYANLYPTAKSTGCAHACACHL